MNILVINGSPKNNYSITLQHVLFLKKHFKQDHFEFFNVKNQVEKVDEDTISDLIDRIAVCDLLLFSYPVYTMSVPYALMNLMESLLKHVNRYKLMETYVSQITTSKHIFDTTAHDYMQTCFRDLGLNILSGHSADSEDLLCDQGQKELIAYMDRLIYQVKTKKKMSHDIIPVKTEQEAFVYEINAEHEKKISNIVVVYNGLTYSDNLKEMIKAFDNMCRYRIHLLDLSNHHFEQSCKGCLACQFKMKCDIYDDFDKMYQEKIDQASVVIIASDIKYHYLDKLFKLLEERAFLKGFDNQGNQQGIGYLLSSEIAYDHHLMTIIKAKAAYNNSYLLDVVEHNQHTQVAIENLCDQVHYYLEKTPYPEKNFYGLAGFDYYKRVVYNHRGVLKDVYKRLKKSKAYENKKRHLLKTWTNRLSLHFIKDANKLNELSIQAYKRVLDEEK